MAPPRGVVEKGDLLPSSPPPPFCGESGPGGTLTGRGQDREASRGLPFEPHSDTDYQVDPHVLLHETRKKPPTLREVSAKT